MIDLDIDVNNISLTLYHTIKGRKYQVKLIDMLKNKELSDEN